MRVKTKTVKIDSDRLRKELLRRGMSMAEASLGIKRISTYIKNAIKDNVTYPFLIQQLQMAYNIDPDTYVIDEDQHNDDERKDDIADRLDRMEKVLESILAVIEKQSAVSNDFFAKW